MTTTATALTPAPSTAVIHIGTLVTNDPSFGAGSPRSSTWENGGGSPLGLIQDAALVIDGRPHCLGR